MNNRPLRKPMDDDNGDIRFRSGTILNNSTTSLRKSVRHSCTNDNPVFDYAVGEQRQQQQNEFKWTIDDQDVSILPEIYPHLVCPLIIRDLSVREISERVSDFMRLNSIRCEYDNRRARAVCSTSCMTFVVQLWRRPTTHHSSSIEDTANKAEKEIIVEVQRRQGCCIGMHRIRHALARSIQSEIARPVRIDMTSSIRRLLIPSTHVKELFKTNSFKLHKSTLSSCHDKDDLTNTIELLESNSHDEEDLGIENLCFLSDVRKVQKEEAMEVARSLIFRSGSQGERLQNAVEDYLFDLQGRPACIETKQRFHAFSALANCMALMIDEVDDETRTTWIADDTTGMLTVFWRNIMEVLLQGLRSFRQSPSSAALAARCIRLLDALAPKDEAHACVDVNHLSHLSYTAYEYGKAYNAMLEEESSNLCNTVANMNQ